MDDKVFNIILHRLDKIDDALHSLQDGQAELQNRQVTLENGQIGLQNGQAGLVAQYNSLAAKQDELTAKQDEILSEQKLMRKDIIGLRDDVDTIYTLQQEGNKTLQRHEAILNVHTDKLNTLITLSEENKEEHIEFDKRISRLEALIS